MGMFDKIEVKYPLPPPGGENFQTKDFDCQLDSLEITQDGRLLRHECDYEEVPKEELKHQGADADPFERILEPTMRVKEGSQRAVEIPHHGDVFIIGDKTGRNDGVLCADNLCAGDFVEYRIRFTNGRVESVELIPERQWT
jgi:hypothetical protein